MPAMNELIAAQATSSKNKKWNKYNAIKAAWHEKILAACTNCGLLAVGPSYFSFYVLEPNQRRDPDGFAFGAIKFILDALVKGGYLDGDGWKHNLGFVPYWATSVVSGVAVFIRPDGIMTKQACIAGLAEMMEGDLATV